MFHWKRPNIDGFPHVYTRFKARDTETDEEVEYRIQDLPEDRHEDAAQFIMHDQYMREEPFAKGQEIKDDPEATQEFLELYRILLNERMSIVCFKEGSDEIVSLNVLFVLDTHVKEIEFPLKTDPLKRILAAGKFVMAQSKPFEPQNDQFVLEGFGLSVDTKYRKRGIAVKMLQARLLVMERYGLNTTSTIFTAIGSQTAALRAGYKEYYAIEFSELEKHGHHFKHLTEKCVKTLGYQLIKS